MSLFDPSIYLVMGISIVLFFFIIFIIRDLPDKNKTSLVFFFEHFRIFLSFLAVSAAIFNLRSTDAEKLMYSYEFRKDFAERDLRDGLDSRIRYYCKFPHTITDFSPKDIKEQIKDFENICLKLTVYQELFIENKSTTLSKDWSRIKWHDNCIYCSDLFSYMNPFFKELDESLVELENNIQKTKRTNTEDFLLFLSPWLIGLIASFSFLKLWIEKDLKKNKFRYRNQDNF